MQWCLPTSSQPGPFGPSPLSNAHPKPITPLVTLAMRGFLFRGFPEIRLIPLAISLIIPQLHLTLQHAMMVYFSRYCCFLVIHALITGAKGIIPQPRTTSPPLLARQTQDQPSNFIGYVSIDGICTSLFISRLFRTRSNKRKKGEPEFCEPGSTITESSTVAACKPTTATAFLLATTCIDGDILVAPGATFPW